MFKSLRGDSGKSGDFGNLFFLPPIDINLLIILLRHFFCSLIFTDFPCEIAEKVGYNCGSP